MEQRRRAEQRKDQSESPHFDKLPISNWLPTAEGAQVSKVNESQSAKLQESLKEAPCKGKANYIASMII